MGPNEEMLKKMAAEECGAAMGCAEPSHSGTKIRGDAGYCLGKATQAPGLKAQVAEHLAYASKQARRLEQLAELQFLLDKNPEVARILDLMEFLKG